jgi:hypothetical protein
MRVDFRPGGDDMLKAHMQCRSSVESKEFQKFADEAVRSAITGIKMRMSGGDTKIASSAGETFNEKSHPSLSGINIEAQLNGEEAGEAAKLAIAIGCHFVKAFVAYSEDIKKKVIHILHIFVLKILILIAHSAQTKIEGPQ